MRQLRVATIIHALLTVSLSEVAAYATGSHANGTAWHSPKYAGGRAAAVITDGGDADAVAGDEQVSSGQNDVARPPWPLRADLATSTIAGAQAPPLESTENIAGWPANASSTRHPIAAASSGCTVDHAHTEIASFWSPRSFLQRWRPVRVLPLPPAQKPTTPTAEDSHEEQGQEQGVGHLPFLVEEHFGEPTGAAAQVFALEPTENLATGGTTASTAAPEVASVRTRGTVDKYDARHEMDLASPPPSSLQVQPPPAEESNPRQKQREGVGDLPPAVRADPADPTVDAALISPQEPMENIGEGDTTTSGTAPAVAAASTCGMVDNDHDRHEMCSGSPPSSSLEPQLPPLPPPPPEEGNAQQQQQEQEQGVGQPPLAVQDHFGTPTGAAAQASPLKPVENPAAGGTTAPTAAAPEEASTNAGGTVDNGHARDETDPASPPSSSGRPQPPPRSPTEKRDGGQYQERGGEGGRLVGSKEEDEESGATSSGVPVMAEDDASLAEVRLLLFSTALAPIAMIIVGFFRCWSRLAQARAGGNTLEEATIAGGSGDGAGATHQQRHENGISAARTDSAAAQAPTAEEAVAATATAADAGAQAGSGGWGAWRPRWDRSTWTGRRWSGFVVKRLYHFLCNAWVDKQQTVTMLDCGQDDLHQDKKPMVDSIAPLRDGSTKIGIQSDGNGYAYSWVLATFLWAVQDAGRLADFRTKLAEGDEAFGLIPEARMRYVRNLRDFVQDCIDAWADSGSDVRFGSKMVVRAVKALMGNLPSAGGASPADGPRDETEHEPFHVRVKRGMGLVGRALDVHWASRNSFAGNLNDLATNHRSLEYDVGATLASARQKYARRDCMRPGCGLGYVVGMIVEVESSRGEGTTDDLTDLCKRAAKRGGNTTQPFVDNLVVVKVSNEQYEVRLTEASMAKYFAEAIAVQPSEEAEEDLATVLQLENLFGAGVLEDAHEMAMRFEARKGAVAEEGKMPAADTGKQACRRTLEADEELASALFAEQVENSELWGKVRWDGEDGNSFEDGYTAVAGGGGGREAGKGEGCRSWQWWESPEPGEDDGWRAGGGGRESV